MINTPGDTVKSESNIIAFPRKPSLNRRRPSGQSPSHYPVNPSSDNIRCIGEGIFAFSINTTSDHAKHDAEKNSFEKPGVKPARTYRVLPTSPASRAYLRSRYVKHMASAIEGGNVQRLKMLFQSETFLNMPAKDKLIIATGIIDKVGDLRLSSCFTQGLADCFLEAFIQGLGAVADFRHWVRYAGTQVNIDTLEGLVLHDDVNEIIRAEATTLLFESYTS